LFCKKEKKKTGAASQEEGGKEDHGATPVGGSFCLRKRSWEGDVPNGKKTTGNSKKESGVAIYCSEGKLPVSVSGHPIGKKVRENEKVPMKEK